MTTKSMGEEGMAWFVGVVEDVNDPEKLGRVRVRAHYLHATDKAVTPTNELPWAVVMVPATSASTAKGVGVSPTGLLVGSTVIGFFMDGNEGQHPVILGTYHGIPGRQAAQHDVHPLARGSNTLNKSAIGPEPASAYAAKYPHNKTLTTARGHAIEIDDTPGKERLHVYHRSGTYVEIDQTGRLVLKVNGNEFHVTAGNQEVYVKGNVNMLVDGTYTLESKGNMTLKAPRIDLNP